MSIRAATCCDVGGLAAIGASVFNALPAALGITAAILACIWYCIQIWESQSIQRLRRAEADAKQHIAAVAEKVAEAHVEAAQVVVEAAKVAAETVVETAKTAAENLK